MLWSVMPLLALGTTALCLCSCYTHLTGEKTEAASGEECSPGGATSPQTWLRHNRVSCSLRFLLAGRHSLSRSCCFNARLFPFCRWKSWRWQWCCSSTEPFHSPFGSVGKSFVTHTKVAWSFPSGLPPSGCLSCGKRGQEDKSALSPKGSLRTK